MRGPMQAAPDITAYRRHWAARFGTAPYLPTSREEMDGLGWDSCDVIIVTGDAYVDHPSFGMAVIGRVLEAQGFRVGIIAQPDWRSAGSFAALGRPNLFFGITAGNMFARRGVPSDWIELDSPHLDAPGPMNAPLDPYAMSAGGPVAADAPPAPPCGGSGPPPGGERVVRFVRRVKNADRERSVIRMPAFEAVAADPVLYAHASRILHLESNPGNARALVQRHGDAEVWLNPPPIPLTTGEMDWVYERPYRRTPHPRYGAALIPAYKMIRFSVAIQRGCFGGCTFCSITERSEEHTSELQSRFDLVC